MKTKLVRPKVEIKPRTVRVRDKYYEYFPLRRIWQTPDGMLVSDKETLNRCYVAKAAEDREEIFIDFRRRTYAVLGAAIISVNKKTFGMECFSDGSLDLRARVLDLPRRAGTQISAKAEVLKAKAFIPGGEKG